MPPAERSGALPAPVLHMEPLAQLEGERTWLEAELLAIEQAIEDQQRTPMLDGEAHDEVIRLLREQLEDHFAQLRSVNAKLAEMRKN
jgi:hypothetical protein